MSKLALKKLETNVEGVKLISRATGKNEWTRSIPLDQSWKGLWCRL